jgi:hypothetical protein
MRCGRRANHKKAKYVTWKDEEKSEIEFYELDKTGKLLSVRWGRLPIHHTEKILSSAGQCLTPNVQETDIGRLKTQSSTTLEDGFGFFDGCTEFGFGTLIGGPDPDFGWNPADDFGFE